MLLFTCEFSIVPQVLETGVGMENVKFEENAGISTSENDGQASGGIYHTGKVYMETIRRRTSARREAKTTMWQIIRKGQKENERKEKTKKGKGKRKKKKQKKGKEGRRKGEERERGKKEERGAQVTAG